METNNTPDWRGLVEQLLAAERGMPGSVKNWFEQAGAGDVIASIEQAILAKPQAQQVAGEVEQWRKLSDPETLHANLLRGRPAKLSREQFLHLAGEQGAGEVVAWSYELWQQDQGESGQSRWHREASDCKPTACDVIRNIRPLTYADTAQPAPVVPDLTPEMVNAAHRYLERFTYWPGFPAEFRWHDLWAAMLAATPTPPAQAAQQGETQ